jgi:hypothetical protein
MKHDVLAGDLSLFVSRDRKRFDAYGSTRYVNTQSLLPSRSRKYAP